jgi:hypothetical protein
MESITDEPMVIRSFPCVVLAGTVMLGLAGCATSGSPTTKVFVRSEGTAWAWRSGITFYTAMGEAMRACQDRSREVGQPELCHVYAAGDEVVWEMSENDREEAVKAYLQ